MKKIEREGEREKKTELTIWLTFTILLSLSLSPYLTLLLYLSISLTLYKSLSFYVFNRKLKQYCKSWSYCQLCLSFPPLFLSISPFFFMYLSLSIYKSQDTVVLIDYEKNWNGGRKREKKRTDNIVNFYNIAFIPLYIKRVIFICTWRDEYCLWKRLKKGERERNTELTILLTFTRGCWATTKKLGAISALALSINPGAAAISVFELTRYLYQSILGFIYRKR